VKIVIRTYSGKTDRKLFDLMEKHHAEVARLMAAIDGLVSYTLARNRRGGFSVTVCQDKRGINKSIKIKQRFIAQHTSGLNLAAMQIIEGEILTHMNNPAAGPSRSAARPAIRKPRKPA